MAILVCLESIIEIEGAAIPDGFRHRVFLNSQGTIASRHESNLETIAYSSCPGALDDVRLSEMIDMVPGKRSILVQRLRTV